MVGFVGVSDRSSDLTFGELLAWHLLRGTRPNGTMERQGQRWAKKDFAHAVRRDARAVRYWLGNEHLPTDTSDVELALFGTVEEKYADWRVALREAHARLTIQSTDEGSRARGQVAGKRLSNIAIRLPRHFLGRTFELEAIHQVLKREETHVAIAALHGLRGVGKSTLAAAYAEKYRNDYTIVWWVRAQLEQTMREDLVSLGRKLGWIDEDESEELALCKTIECLESRGESTLLVFDNAVSAKHLKRFLPRTGEARILVTSTMHAWRELAAPIEIAVWPKEIAASYLIARTGREDERGGAENLAEVLGYLPLAHEQAAAYCERLDVSLSEYLHRFECAAGRMLDDEKHAPTEYNGGLTVAKTYALAIEEAAKLNPAAGVLMSYAAALPPDPIPIFFFLEGLKWTKEAAFSEEAIHDAIAALRAFALVGRVSVTDENASPIDAIHLHRLVKEVALGLQGSGQAEEVRLNLGIAAVKVYPEPQPSSHDDPDAWGRCRVLSSLVSSIIESEMERPTRLGVGVVNLLRRLAIYRYRVLGDTTKARQLLETAVATIERHLGANDPGIASTLNELADVVQNQGDLVEARRLLERALSVYESAKGSDHLDTASNMHNLAVLLVDMGDLSIAEGLFERSGRVLETAFTDDARLAGVISGRAKLLIASNQLAEARRLLENAVAIREKILGQRHPATALGLSRLAELMMAQGERSAALPLLERTVSIYEEVLGSDHPETRSALSKLSAANSQLG